jgi:hypothetical protein
MNAEKIKDQLRSPYAYEGPLGEVVCYGRDFFAWKEGRLIGTYPTLEEAMESLEQRERPKTHEA